jgi:hypothetical protein
MYLARCNVGMGKVFQIAITDIDLFQLLDGLRIRAEAWRNTAKYLETGESAVEFFVCEECSDAGEATQIADHYDKIIALLERQAGEQRG